MGVRMIQTQSRWGVGYIRRHYVGGRRVSRSAFDREWEAAGMTPELGRTESTPYGFRTLWESS